MLAAMNAHKFTFELTLTEANTVLQALLGRRQQLGRSLSYWFSPDLNDQVKELDAMIDRIQAFIRHNEPQRVALP